MSKIEDMQQELADECSCKSKAGRPLYWTTERVDELADDLEAWGKTSKALCIADFFLDRDMNPAIARKLNAIHPQFRTRYYQTLRRIGSRREQGAINKKFEPKTVSRYSRLYDADFDEQIKKELAEDELIKAKAKLEAIEKAINNKGAISEYIESQKAIKKILDE